MIEYYNADNMSALAHWMRELKHRILYFQVVPYLSGDKQRYSVFVLCEDTRIPDEFTEAAKRALGH